jgi:excisionase family DNA binding protein
MPDTERWVLSPKEVQERLGLSKTTCYALIQSGVIPSVRLGRSIKVPASALRQWIERQANEASDAR